MLQTAQKPVGYLKRSTRTEIIGGSYDAFGELSGSIGLIPGYHVLNILFNKYTNVFCKPDRTSFKVVTHRVLEESRWRAFSSKKLPLQKVHHWSYSKVVDHHISIICYSLCMMHTFPQ